MKNKILTALIICLTIFVTLFAFTSCKKEEVYKVTFTNGTEVSVVDVVEGGKVTEPSDPTKTGYEFDGWFNGETAWNFESDVVSANVELKAKFTAINYTITYDLAGGTVATANPTSYNIESQAFTLNNPTKNYYDFNGWVVNNAPIQESYTVATGSTGNLNCVAVFTATKFNITYNLDGGIATNPATYTVEDEFTLATPFKPGYTFDGWTWDGQTEPVKVVNIALNTNGNKEFTANYSVTNIELTYNLDNGTVATENPTVITVNTDTFTLVNPTRKGSEFIRWTWAGQTEPVLNVTINKGTLLTSRTFIANYQVETYNISYVLNGGTLAISNPATYTVETDTFVLTNPTKEYQVFVGWTWNYSSEPQDVVTITRGQYAENLEFVAVFENAYTIDDNGVITGIHAKALNVSTLVIPAKVGEVDVVSISANVFDGVTVISNFESNCDAITVVNGALLINEGKELVKYAPANQASSFTVPESVEVIYAGAFANATNLVEVIINDNVTSVLGDLFAGTTNIVVKVEDSTKSAEFANNWADNAKDVIFDYLTGDDDDVVIQ